ncbi:MAG: hypothetical protein M1819_006011 [Sarea resinae]|nr:MAG: hypothetical protein M1819_006011 [Sarea resinae]
MKYRDAYGLWDRKFYLLSKSHHPDRNLNDPEAASRFVKVSEAYAVLGSPKKRERYDSERHHTSSSSGSRQGSHSSTSGPAGARPASGLSKRRTHFRGPPPSFYRSGGWGSQGEKRRTQAQASATATAASASGSGAGFGPGGTQTGREDDVPHFNRTAHLRTQEQTEERRRKRMVDDSTFLQSEGSVLFNVVLIGGIITLAVFLPSMFEKGAMREKKATKDATSR